MQENDKTIMDRMEARENEIRILESKKYKAVEDLVLKREMKERAKRADKLLDLWKTKVNAM